MKHLHILHNLELKNMQSHQQPAHEQVQSTNILPTSKHPLLPHEAKEYQIHTTNEQIDNHQNVIGPIYRNL